MKSLVQIKLFFVFILSAVNLHAYGNEHLQIKTIESVVLKKNNSLGLIPCCLKKCSSKCQLGIAGFSTNNPADWYTLNTFPFPETVLLSINRNRGSVQGKVELTPTGLRIGKPGNYSVSFTAILINNNPLYTPLIPVFLIRNGVFDPNDTSGVGSIGALLLGVPTVIQATGILENVKAGTELTLVATNGGSPQPEEITVISWGINAFKIECGKKK